MDAVNRISIEDTLGNTVLNLTSPEPPRTVTISEPGGRVVLKLDMSDGTMKAEYDPADLDEACQVFVDHLLAYVMAGWEKKPCSSAN